MHDRDEKGTLTPGMHTWLEQQFSAVNGKHCGVMLLSVTSA